MEFFHGIPLTTIVSITSILGLPGLFAIFWYLSDRRTLDILRQYKEHIDQLAEQYRSNVRLVEKYERMADDLSSVVAVNTRIMTQLSERIMNNMYCPVVRGKGPERDN